MGAGFLVRWLSENDVEVGKVILVAPSIVQPKATVGDFLDFAIDPNMAAKTKGLVVFYSDNDSERINQSVDKLKEGVAKASFHEFHGYGHFTFNDMGKREFSELLEEVLK
jgi:predicted alpha/beta hydrolase family esterase